MLSLVVGGQHYGMRGYLNCESLGHVKNDRGEEEIDLVDQLFICQRL